MDSTVIKVRNDRNEFCIKRYLPVLQEAPDFSRPFFLPINSTMPTLIAAPKLGKITKRRNTEYFPKKKAAKIPMTLDDSTLPTRKYHRRTKEEIKQARIEEFKKKQEEELARIKQGEQYPATLPLKQPMKRPRMKSVHLDVHQVLNMAYVTSKGERIFNCVSVWCRHKSKDATKFLSHLQNHHRDDSTLKSHSFCKMCDSKIDAQTLEEEFKHMIICHVDELGNLDSLINLLCDQSSIKTKTYVESYEIDNQKFELESSVIVNTRTCSEETRKYLEIENQLNQMFAEGSKQRVNILQVETLPNIDVFASLETETEMKVETLAVKDTESIEFASNDSDLINGVPDGISSVKNQISEDEYFEEIKRGKINDEVVPNEGIIKQDIADESSFNKCVASVTDLFVNGCNFGVLEPIVKIEDEKTNEEVNQVTANCCDYNEDEENGKIVELSSTRIRKSKGEIKSFDATLRKSVIVENSPNKKLKDGDNQDPDEGYNDESGSEEGIISKNDIMKLENIITRTEANLETQSNKPVQSDNAETQIKRSYSECEKISEIQNSTLDVSKNFCNLKPQFKNIETVISNQNQNAVDDNSKCNSSQIPMKNDTQNLNRSLSYPADIKTTPTSKVLHRSISEKTDKPSLKKFKRSLSVVRNLNQFDEVSNIEHDKVATKVLGSKFIDKLLLEEKSAQPSKTSPQRRDSVINFEASTSKVLKTNANDHLKTSLTTHQSHENSCNRLNVCSPADLMPWMNIKSLRKNSKFEVCYKKMLNKNSLIALYKCMCLRCSFTTNEAELFLNHLLQHKKSRSHKDSFYCPYCLYKDKEPKPLAHHIHDAHMKDIYQCSRCFYRSREKETCYHHTLKSHKHEETKIYKCGSNEQSERDKIIIMDRLKRKRSSFVAPIRCQCKFQFARLSIKLLVNVLFVFLFLGFLCF